MQKLNFNFSVEIVLLGLQIALREIFLLKLSPDINII